MQDRNHAAVEYLLDRLRESVQSERRALRDWAFERDTHRQLRSAIQALSPEDAIKIAAWLDQPTGDKDVPVALRIFYAVHHLSRLPPPPSHYALPRLPWKPDPWPIRDALESPHAQPTGRGPALSIPPPTSPPPVPQPPPSSRLAVAPSSSTVPSDRQPRPPVERLFHFTAPENLPSIARHGLLSLKELTRRGLDFYPSSSDLSRELDRRRGLHHFVHLCLQPYHPMAWRAYYEGRVRGFVWLEIDASVAARPSTRFSDTNTAKKGARISADWRTAFESGDAQAEVLVKDRIEPELIVNLQNCLWALHPRG